MRLIDVFNDAICHAIDESAQQHGRHYVGTDVDGRPIFKAKARP